MTFPIRTTLTGHAFLNVGCGTVYAKDWNNLDFIGNKDVHAYDLRRGLPYPDACMDGTYSSHVLEHFTPEAGAALLREMRRVTKPQGIVRIAVPDLERIAREYLANLEAVLNEPSDQKRFRYHWVTLELLDQLVRERSGGTIRALLASGNFDRTYVENRIGDIAREPEKANTGKPKASFMRRVVRALRAHFKSNDPRASGEVHRWMYDRFSLAEALRTAGFIEPRIVAFDQSAIPDWNLYNLDASPHAPNRARKPDSLFMEAIRA